MAADQINEAMRFSYPPLDPNGQPFSMTLRGSLAELGKLRSMLMDKSIGGKLMQVGSEGSEFDDADQHDHMRGVDTNESRPMQEDFSCAGDDVNNSTKRRRDEADDDEEEGICGDESIVEDLLLYLPSVQCTCSSWDMTNVQGDLLVTSIRVLFVACNNDGAQRPGNYNDIAIDGRCIALHAVDSVAEDDAEKKCDVLPHVYCQLCDPASESNDARCGTSFGIMSSASDMDGHDNEYDNEAEENEENQKSDENDIIEVYFKPMICEHITSKDQHIEACQKLFQALTKLASLNPAYDSDDGYTGGGGLFDMLTLMAGMSENSLVGGYDDPDDDMVIRLGGSNNHFVEDDEESEGAPEDERQAMLNRLDNILVVPPEYEILSEESEGQFDDAENDDFL